MARRGTDGPLSAVDIRAAFDAVSKLIGDANHPDLFGESTSLDPRWSDRWYGDCAALCIQFDFLDKWKGELAKRPAEQEGHTAFTQDSLNPMLHTLGRVISDLLVQTSRITQALQEEIADSSRKLAEYQRIETDLKAARRS